MCIRDRAKIVENAKRGAQKKTCHWQRTGSALKKNYATLYGGTSRTIDASEKTFEKSLGVILETSCTSEDTYSELRRFAAHSRERGCPHANASWNVSRRPKIPLGPPKDAPRLPIDTAKTPQDAPKKPQYTPKTSPRRLENLPKIAPRSLPRRAST